MNIFWHLDILTFEPDRGTVYSRAVIYVGTNDEGYKMYIPGDSSVPVREPTTGENQGILW